jgi:hypothetical protein
VAANCRHAPDYPSASQGGVTPGVAAGEQLRELGLEHAELIALRVAQQPEVVAPLLLVVSAGGAERFEALNLSRSPR